MTKTPVVDSHHHFWDPTKRNYYWMGGDELTSIRKPFGPADMRSLLAQNEVDYTVVVQTVPAVEETKELLSIAENADFVTGVVGWVDLTDPGVGDALSELQDEDNGKWLVGIRHQLHDEEDPDWVIREDVIRGINAVGKAGLAFDLLPKQRELPACLPAVDANPDMRFVVNHIAKPLIAAGKMEPWASRLKALAKRPNVYCKLSGMVTEADWNDWKPEHLKPYVDCVLEWFGEDRVMFGSDWPVCLLAADYDTVKGALESILGDLGWDTYAKIFGSNATAFYHL